MKNNRELLYWSVVASKHRNNMFTEEDAKIILEAMNEARKQSFEAAVKSLSGRPKGKPFSMKSRYWIIVSCVLLLPLFFSMLGNLIAALSYQGYDAAHIQKFNHEFIAWCAVIGMFAVAVVITTFTHVLPKNEYIDRLEDAIWEYHQAKEKYLQKSKQFSDTFLKQ